MQHKFKKSALAICISLLSQGIYAQSPHSTINLTDEIAKQYTGKGVKLGVVDAGFILGHHNLDNTKITPIKFEMTTPAGGVEPYDPEEDTVIDDGEESGLVIYSFHGGAVSGTINGVNSNALPKTDEALPFEGGVAPNSHLVVASLESYKEDENFHADVSVVDLFGKSQAEIYDLAKNAKAITKVAEQGVFAINNSWGMGGVENFDDAKDAYYAEQAKSENGRSNALINAIKDAVKNHNTLFAFATGNAAPATESEPDKQGEANPDVMSMLPRYFPELERNFLAVSAADHKGIESYAHRCGYAKNWCITAPGSFLGLMMLADPETGEAIHHIESHQGTSFSTPVVTGSLGVLKERFDYMTPTQVRDTLLTTAKDLGETGVDNVYGWGLVDLAKAVKGPAQLLNDETYTVTKDDKWQNPIDSAQYKLTKNGVSTLTLEGETKLKEIQVDNGRLNLNATTTAPTIRNHAELGVATTLSSQIIGADNSTTHFASNAHWKMPENTTLGNVVMEDGSQITLNPAHSKANGNPDNVAKFNTLTIYNNLSGQGQFNFVSRLANNESDKVVVNGTAKGQFKLQVENTGAEPSSPQQLDLVELAKPNESEVFFSLANNVDLGVYRYTLAKSNDSNRYYLYNPKKEQELEAQRQAEEQRKAEEAARLAEEQRKAEEAARLAEEQRKAEEAARLAEEQRKAEEAARLAEEQRKAEEAARLAEEQRKAEEAARLAEAQRKAEEKKVQETAKAPVKPADKPVFKPTQPTPVQPTPVKPAGQPKQAELTSRYSNTALSDVSVQVNNLLSLGKTLDQRLFEKVDVVNVWSNVEGLNGKRTSDNYRAYEQRGQLTQLGVQAALNATSDVGFVLSQAKTTADFDKEGQSKARFNSVNAFVKNDIGNVLSQFEIGVGKAKDRISVGNKVAELSRNSLNLGFLLGYNWDLDGFKLQPSVGVRYHRLAGANYRLDNAEVKVDTLNLLAYQAGVKAGKTFKVGDLALTPSLASYYVATSAKDNAVSVNGRKLTQQYGNQFHHEVALGTQWKNWEVSAKAGVKTGKELHRQRYWGVDFGYRW